jgi:hypothetical protein
MVYRRWIKRRTPIVAMVDNLALYSPSKDFCDISGERTYEEWSEQVRELTKRRKAAFLEFNVNGGWGPLCDLLGVEVPDVPFQD